MGQSQWSYLQNPFDNVTKKSYKQMFLMATDHFDKLLVNSADREIKDLYLFGKPYFDAFCIQYRKSNTDISTYQMLTERTVKLLDELSSTLARRWDVQVQAVFDTTDAEYKSILPKGRALFQNGAYDLRINEVLNFANRLRPYAEFVRLESEVKTFHIKIIETRSRQQGAESLVQMNSQDIETKRVALAQAMHSIFGQLLHLYFNDTEKVEAYYELKYLRKISSDKNEGSVIIEDVEIAPNQTFVGLEGKLKDKKEVTVLNTGDTTLIVYLAENEMSNTFENNRFVLEPTKKTTLSIGEKDNVLLIKNTNETLSGRAVIELWE